MSARDQANHVQREAEMRQDRHEHMERCADTVGREAVVSDTPKTDAACRELPPALASLARKLERDNAMLRETCRTSIPQDVAFARYRDYEAMKERAEAAEALVAEKDKALNDAAAYIDDCGAQAGANGAIEDIHAALALTPAGMATELSALRKDKARLEFVAVQYWNAIRYCCGVDGDDWRNDFRGTLDKTSARYAKADEARKATT